MPTLASTNRVQVAYKPEVTPGVPVTASVATYLRMTGESINLDVKKDSDKEIRSDRQRVSVASVSAQAGGALNIHMQYAEYDQLLAGLLQSAWVAAGTNGVSASLTAVTVATGTTAPVISGTAMPLLAKGQWFQFSHSLYTPTGGTIGSFQLLRAHPVTACTATVITVDVNTLLNTATLASGTGLIRTSRLTNGTTLQSYTLEFKISDITVPVFQTFKGMFPSKLSVTFNSAALTEGSIEFLGFTMTSSTTTGLNAGAANASQPYDVQNGVRGVGNIWENGAPLTTTFIKSISLNIDNSLRGQEALGNFGLVGVGVGTFMVNGSVEIYFADGSLYNKFLSDTFTSLVFSSQDTAGNGYVFTIPRVMLTSGKVDAGSSNADLIASFNWEAYADVNNADTTLRQTIFIDRVGVAVLPVT